VIFVLLYWHRKLSAAAQFCSPDTSKMTRFLWPMVYNELRFVGQQQTVQHIATSKCCRFVVSFPFVTGYSLLCNESIQLIIVSGV